MTHDDAVLAVRPLGFQWETQDPFLFCVHHDDAYPEGNEKLRPKASLAGRDIGQDFEGKDGWRMYHGEVVPGFPAHPHRGFETVTIVRKGFIDHSDSLGATARFGHGDVQWLTAGAGIVHCEMFPLVKPDAPNPVELFQIWMNLASADKMVAPHFSMFWNSNIPRRIERDEAGRTTEVTIIAGQLVDTRAPAPPPKSWASKTDSDVAIWTMKMAPGARWTLPRAKAGTNRSLYFFRGSALTVAGKSISGYSGIFLRGDRDVEIENGPDETELLLLQGRPIKEPVAAYGPFVMNTRSEIQQAFSDYQRTRFGGWPWKSEAPVHAREEGKFAKRPDGSHERGE